MSMASMRGDVVLSIDRAAGTLVVQRAGPVARLMARWRKTKLDRALAAGVSPESDVALELRARALMDHERRVALRTNVETLFVMTQRPAPLGSRWAILSVRRVRRVADELERLAAALEGSGPVDVRGLALVRMLLVDGSSPLYGSGDEPVEDLRAAIERAIDGLRAQPSSDERRRST